MPAAFAGGMPALTFFRFLTISERSIFRPCVALCAARAVAAASAGESSVRLALVVPSGALRLCLAGAAAEGVGCGAARDTLVGPMQSLAAGGLPAARAC